MNLLNCVISYNKEWYLRNAVKSVVEIFRFGDVLVVDDDSDAPGLKGYLEELEAEGVQVIRNRHKESAEPLSSKVGGLYTCMQKALDFANKEGYDYIQFIHDDMQIMWHDPRILEEVETIFDGRGDAVQVHSQFPRRIGLDTRSRLSEYYSEERCYYAEPYGMSDLGIVKLSIVNKHGFRFKESENAVSRYWREKGYRLYLLHSPNLAPIPWPASFYLRERQGDLRPPSEEFYLKPLDSGQVERLQNHPPQDIPFEEDYCLPWGWACLKPYWVSAWSGKVLGPRNEYLRLLLRHWWRGHPVIPRWVSAGRPSYFLPPRSLVVQILAREAYGLLPPRVRSTLGRLRRFSKTRSSKGKIRV